MKSPRKQIRIFESQSGINFGSPVRPSIVSRQPISPSPSANKKIIVQAKTLYRGRARGKSEEIKTEDGLRLLSVSPRRIRYFCDQRILYSERYFRRAD